MTAEEVMIEVLRSEKFDRKHGFTLPGDSALAITIAGFEEHLATTKQRRKRILVLEKTNGICRPWIDT